MSADDVDVLARTLWGEARGERSQGRQAVACVILNRVARPGWPNDVAQVCLQPWQFSCWNDDDPNRDKLQAVDADDPQFADALRVAKLAIAGDLFDITEGADHYHATSIDPPSWVKGAKPSATIGDHVFYKLT